VDRTKWFRFNGKTGKSNSRTHAAKSKNMPYGGLAYKALCGTVITTNGGSLEGVDCPRCLRQIRRGEG
jgi:hypothetical protein